MARENEDLVRRMIEAVNVGDFATAREFFADDVELLLHGEAAILAGPGATGKEAFADWFADWFRTFERGYRFTLGELQSEGDRVQVEIMHHARGRASGVEVTMPSAWVFTFRDGEIVQADGS